MLRAVLRLDRRPPRSAGGLRGVEAAVWPRSGCATPLPCAHACHRAGGGAKVLRSARGVSTRRQFLWLGILPRRLAGTRSEEHSLNSSHLVISYAVFCLKKKKKKMRIRNIYAYI